MQASPALDTQAKLAKASGVAQSTVGRLLRGEVSATLDNIEAMADAFGRPVTDLLTSPGQKASNEMDRLITRLPQSEAEKIVHFAQFVASQNSVQIDPSFHIDTESSFGEHSRAIQDAAKRPPGNQLGEDLNHAGADPKQKSRLRKI